jgi:hypothetical protein
LRFAAAARLNQFPGGWSDDKIGIHRSGGIRRREVQKVTGRLDRLPCELLDEQLTVAPIDRRDDWLGALGTSREQGQRRHSVKLAVPGDCQPLRSCNAYANTGETPGAHPDEDPARPATAEHLVEHRNETLAVASSDQLILVRDAGAVAVE